MHKSGSVNVKKVFIGVYDSRRLLLQWEIKNKKSGGEMVKSTQIFQSRESFTFDIYRKNSISLSQRLSSSETSSKQSNKSYFEKFYCVRSKTEH